MSVFQRLSQLALHKSAHHFQVQFHDVTDFYEDTTTAAAAAAAAAQSSSVAAAAQPAAEPERYYCSCERNSKRYRTEPVAAIPKKQLGVLQSAAAAAASAAYSDGAPRSSLSLQHAHTQSQEDSAAAANGGGAGGAGYQSQKHHSLTFTPGQSYSLSSSAAGAAAASSSDAIATPAASAAARSSSCVLLFEQTLSFGCSLYRGSGSSGAFNKKVFRFRLKAVKPAGGAKHASAGSKVDLYADVNLAAFASKGVRHATLVFPLIGKPDPPAGRAPPQLRCTITCMYLNDAASAKDKDGYSSCSKSIGSSRHTSGAGGAAGASSRLSSNRYQAEFSRDRHSIYPRNASDARMFEFAGGSGGSIGMGRDSSREHSRVGVAFYGHDGSNVWDSQVGTIYDGFPPEQNAVQPLPPPPQPQQQQQQPQLMNGPPINPASSPSASNGQHQQQQAGSGLAGLSVIRASGANSRNSSRVASRVTSPEDAGRDMSDFELRQRRRENEEKQQQQAMDQIQQQHSDGSIGSISPHPPRRYGSARRENGAGAADDRPSSIVSPLNGGDLSPNRPSPSPHSPLSASLDAQFFASNTRPHSSSMPAMPAMTLPAAAGAGAGSTAASAAATNTSGKHSRRTHSGSSGSGFAGLHSSPLSSPSSSAGDAADYVDLSTIDLLSGVQARDEAQQADHAAAAAAAAAANRASILASFRHSPHSASASSVLMGGGGSSAAARAKRPSIIQEEPQIHPAPSAAAFAALPASSSANQAQSARSKLQAIEDNRMRNAARNASASAATAGANVGAARFNAVIPAASLPLNNAAPAGLTSSAQPSLIKTLSGRSSPAVSVGPSGSLSARAPASSIGSSIGSGSGGDDWLSSIRAQLPPVTVDPNSILVSTVAAAVSGDHRPRSSSSSDSAVPPQNSSASLFPPRKPAPASSNATHVAPVSNGHSSNGLAVPALVRNSTTPQPQLLPPHTPLSSLSFGAEGRLEISEMMHQSSDPVASSAGAAASPSRHALRHYGHSDASAPPLHSNGHSYNHSHVAPHSHSHSHAHAVVQQICSIHFSAFSDLARFHEGNFGVIWRARMPVHLLPAQQQTHLHSLTRARAASAGLSSTGGSSSALTAGQHSTAVPMLDVVIKVPRRRPGPDEIAELFSFLNLPPHEHVLPFLGLCTDWRTPAPVATSNAIAATAAAEPGATRSPSARGERLFCFVTELQQCNLKELALQLPPWRSASSSGSGSAAASANAATDPDPLLLLQLLREMAAGLAHFHACHSIHRDISLRNFLLSQANSVLLCDFGLSRVMDSTQGQTTEGHGGLFGGAGAASGDSLAAGSGESAPSSSLPLRWLAPESLLSHRFSYASDIWSFGVAAWELVSQSPALPYAHVSNMREVVSLVCTGEMTLDFGAGAQCSPRLAQMLSQCLAVTPSKRPRVVWILGQIEEMIAEWYGESKAVAASASAATAEAESGAHQLDPSAASSAISSSDELQMSSQ